MKKLLLTLPVVASIPLTMVSCTLQERDDSLEQNQNNIGEEKKGVNPKKLQYYAMKYATNQDWKTDIYYWADGTSKLQVWYNFDGRDNLETSSKEPKSLTETKIWLDELIETGKWDGKTTLGISALGWDGFITISAQDVPKLFEW